MSSTRQKDEERFYLDRFLILMNWIPESVQSSERPDFVVTLEGNRIGIEVSMYHSRAKDARGRPRRAMEEHWNCLQEELMKQVLGHKELSGACGFLQFKEQRLPTRRERSEFVREVINLSSRHCPKHEREEKELSLADHATQCPTAARYLEEIRLVGIPATWEHNLTVAFAGPEDGDLLALVSDKAKKTESYDKSNLQGLWLLIVSGELLSQATRRILAEELNEKVDLNDALKQSLFDKTFLFQYMRDRVLQFDRSLACWRLLKEEQH